MANRLRLVASPDGTDGSVLWARGTGNRVYSVSWLGDVIKFLSDHDPDLTLR